MDIAIRDAADEDLAPIVAIYNAAVPERMGTADADPVTVADWQPWFDRRTDDHHPVWVAVSNGEIVGWLSFDPYRARTGFRATAEVRYYVAPAVRRRGVARRLLARAQREVSKLELTTLLLYILDHNRPSIALGEKLGFEEWGRLRRVATLDGVDRDHLILGWRVPDPPSPEGSRSSGSGTRTDRRGGETA